MWLWHSRVDIATKGLLGCLGVWLFFWRSTVLCLTVMRTCTCTCACVWIHFLTFHMGLIWLMTTFVPILDRYRPVLVALLTKRFFTNFTILFFYAKSNTIYCFNNTALSWNVHPMLLSTCSGHKYGKILYFNLRWTPFTPHNSVIVCVQQNNARMFK